MRLLWRSTPIVLLLLLVSSIAAFTSASRAALERTKKGASTLPLSLKHPWYYSGDKKTATALATGQGGGSEQEKKQHPVKSNSQQQQLQKIKLILGTCAVLVAASYGWVFRETLAEVFDKKKLQDKTLEILKALDALPKHQSYSIYIMGMACWEMLGMSTIPVETAAGMIFGWRGALLSGGGKLLGAIIAFCIGRFGILADWIQSTLAKNSFLNLVKEETESKPFQVALLLKFSCFPETIKNYGSAFLFPIRLWMFMSATIVHGWTFSALWTYLGVDTAKRLVDPSLPADARLQLLILLSIINGIFVSPGLMVYWIRDLSATKEAHNKGVNASKQNRGKKIH